MEGFRFGLKELAIGFGLACGISLSGYASQTVTSHCPSPDAFSKIRDSRNYMVQQLVPPTGWHVVSSAWITTGSPLEFVVAYAWLIPTQGSSASQSLTCAYRTSVSSDDTVSIALDNPKRVTFSLINTDSFDSTNRWDYKFNVSKNLARCFSTTPNAYYKCGFTYTVN